MKRVCWRIKYGTSRWWETDMDNQLSRNVGFKVSWVLINLRNVNGIIRDRLTVMLLRRWPS